MPRSVLMPALALVVGMAAGAHAQAQTTPEQARSLEAQITGWLKQVTGGAVKLSPRPVELTAEGDHFLVRVPFAQFGKVDPADAAFTAKARALDGTRWALDDQQFPPALTIATTEMVPDAPDAKDPSPDGKHSEPVTFALKLGPQDVHGVFDPTYSTPTTSGGTVASLDLTKTGGMAPSVTHIGRFTTQTSSQPVDPGHVNILGDATAAGYMLTSQTPDGSSITLGMDRVHIVSTVSALAHDQIVPVIQALAALGQLAKAHPDDNSDGPSPAEKAALRTLLGKAQALLTGSKVDETMEGVKFDFAGTAGTADKAEISFGGDAPRDMLSADFGFTLDGLKIDDLPPNLAVYVPTHIAIHPTVANVSVAVLTKMGMDATAPTTPGQAPVPPPDMQALFAKGPITVGFDKMDLDVVGTKLTGTGTFQMTGPQTIAGQAQFTAQGLDALVTKMQADPMLASGVPVVIFLKGIARTTGDQAVWQVTVNNTKVLVNGVDLSAMAGAMSK